MWFENYYHNWHIRGYITCRAHVVYFKIELTNGTLIIHIWKRDIIGNEIHFTATQNDTQHSINLLNTLMTFHF